MASMRVSSSPGEKSYCTWSYCSVHGITYNCFINLYVSFVISAQNFKRTELTIN